MVGLLERVNPEIFIPMSLEKKDVQRAAVLARIEITETEANETFEQLEKVFDLIEQMKIVNTEDIAPMAHAQDISTRLRDDIVTEKDRHEEFQEVAPATERGLYLVPKVIE